MVIKRVTHFWKKRHFYDLMHCWSGDALSGQKVRRTYSPTPNFGLRISDFGSLSFKSEIRNWKSEIENLSFEPYFCLSNLSNRLQKIVKPY